MLPGCSCGLHQLPVNHLNPIMALRRLMLLTSVKFINIRRNGNQVNASFLDRTRK